MLSYIKLIIYAMYLVYIIKTNIKMIFVNLIYNKDSSI